MRAKFVNEKFKDDTDPIRDMGIGILPLLTKEWIKLLQQTTNDIYIEYFSRVKFDTYSIATNTVASFYYNLIKRLKEEASEGGNYQPEFDKEVYNLNRAVGYREDSSGLDSIIKKAAEIIDKKFGIKVNTDK